MNVYRIMADFTVVAHLGYVLFVVIGLLLILLGALLKWKWVRNPWFRLTHFSMIAIVVVESLLSITCPLTTLENFLRKQAGEVTDERSFVGRLAHDLLFYDLSPEFFTIAYCSFGALVVGTFLIAPPELRRTRK